MNSKAIEILFRENFKRDGIKRSDVFTTFQIKPNNVIEYDLNNDFVEYVNKVVRNLPSFYEYCKEVLQKDKLDEMELVKRTIKEIRKSCTIFDENDLEDSDFVYDWYLESRVECLLCEDIDFFFDILDSL